MSDRAIDRETAAFLRGLEDSWEKAAETAKTAGQFQRYPDGKYLCRLTSTSIGPSEGSGRMQVTWGYTIMEGELKGSLHRSFQGLDNEKSLEFLARDLSRFGYDPQDLKLSRLPALLDEIAEAKPWVLIRLKSKGEFQNTYIDRFLGTDYSPEDEELEEPASQESPSPVEAPHLEEVAGSSDASDAADAGDDSDEIELAVGMQVEFDKNGKTLKGKITGLDEDTGTVTVLANKMRHKIPVENIVVLDTGVVA